MPRILIAPAILSAALLSACASKQVQPEQPLVAYVCTGDVTNILADYYQSGKPRAIVTVNDTKYTLYRTLSANGSTGTRYTNNPSSTDAKPGSFVWFTKGTDAILYTIAARTNGSAYEKQVAYCTSNPQPLYQNAPALPVPNPLPGTIPGTAPGIIYAPTN